MYKLQRVIGLPVIDGNTGNQAGNVQDVWFDEHWMLTGIILKAKRWWFATYYMVVKGEQVEAWGEDAVIIKNKNAVRKLPHAEIGRSFRSGIVRMKDLPIVTESGKQLGRVSDVYFQEIKGTPIVGFEISDGFVSDLMEGRKWLRTPADSSEWKLGDDAIVVPARCEEDLETIVTDSG